MMVKIEDIQNYGKEHLDSVAASASNMQSGSEPNPRFRIGAYDPVFAFRRVSLLYCGRSPTYDELTALNDGAPSDDALKQRVHDALDRCLVNQHHRDVIFDGVNTITSDAFQTAAIGFDFDLCLAFRTRKYFQQFLADRHSYP